MTSQQAERLIAALERIADALAPKDVEAVATPGSCPHCGAPEEKQRDASTLGGRPKKQCLVCAEEYDG